MKRLSARVGGLLALLWIAAPTLPSALALKPSGEIEDAGQIWQWVATVAMVGVWALVFFKNAKRTPQN